MSTTTTNFGLLKPQLTDPSDITQTNQNWDIIDEKLKTIEDGLDDAVNNSIPTDHASSAQIYGMGTTNKFGHVKLSDATNNTSGSASGIAATPAAVKIVYDEVMKKADANHGVHVPSSSTSDNGKFLRVVNGVATWTTVPNAEGVNF